MKQDWENRLRQIINNCKGEEKASKLINLVRQLLLQQKTEIEKSIKKRRAIAVGTGFRAGIEESINIINDLSNQKEEE